MNVIDLLNYFLISDQIWNEMVTVVDIKRVTITFSSVSCLYYLNGNYLKMVSKRVID